MRQANPIIVCGALQCQFALGVVHTWSVFAEYIKRIYGWSNTQAMFVYGAELFTFALIMFAASRFAGRLSPRRQVLTGALLLAAGYLYAAYHPGDFAATLMAFITIGAGTGLAYMPPLTECIRGFAPSSRGVVTGIVVAGFGLGYLTFGRLAGGYIGLLEGCGVSSVFAFFGAIVTVLVASCSMSLPDRSEQTVVSSVPTDSGFRSLWLSFALHCAAGLTTTGLLLGLADSAGVGVEQAQLAALVVMPLANIGGRILYGLLSDLIGRPSALTVLTAAQAAAVLAAPSMIADPSWLLVVASIIGINFGGIFALFPAIVADRYGSGRVASVYPALFLAYGVGGIVGPVLTAVAADAGQHKLAFLAAGILLIGGMSVRVREDKEALAAVE